MNNSAEDAKPWKTASGDPSSNIISAGTVAGIILPLQMMWSPKKDITTYELAQCLPYLLGQKSTMPSQIDKTESHFRHFDIIDHYKT